MDVSLYWRIAHKTADGKVKENKCKVLENIFGLFEQSISLESVALFFTINFPGELIQGTMGGNLVEAKIAAQISSKGDITKN